jgi:23S rRNA (uracil1939-C5)-methyltransferase
VTENLTINRLGRQGEGIALHNGKTVYVPFALPGEKLSADVHEDRGVIIKLLESSPLRVKPFCRHFMACGGCALQHLDPEEYRKWKRGLVASAMERAGLHTEVLDLVDAHGEGRRRATLHARAAGSGFNAARSHKVHPMDQCPVLVPALSRASDIANAVYAAVGDSDVILTVTDGGLDCAVKAQKHAKASLLVPLASQFALARITLNGDIVVTVGPPEITIARSRVTLPPGSFLQATSKGEDVLGARVKEILGGARNVADLFCGVGPFGLRLAEKTKIHAYDNDGAAIAALKDAVRKTQGIKPLSAEVRDLFREPLTVGELSGFDAVVFDPPRAGAEAQSRNLAKMKMKKIAAVSCDLSSFVRDATILTGGGYRLESVLPVDQFAWTPHVELVGAFSR